MELKCLSLSNLEQVRQWRNESLDILRTSFPLTEEMQKQFYHDIICNRKSNARYWGIWNEDELSSRDKVPFISIELENAQWEDELKFIGMCGIENIQWENRNGEISLLLNPDLSTNDDLQEALILTLEKGFNNLNLENIYTEVYECSKHYNFWEKQIKKYNTRLAILPNRKYWNGKYYDSEYINFNKERYNENFIIKSS